MAEVTRRRTGEFVRKLFQILTDHPEGIQAGEALAALRAHFQLTEYEKGTYEGGGPRFDKIVRFATVDCVKAGWLIKQKGKWSVTEEGRDAFRRYADPEAFYKEAIRLYRQWKATRPVDDDPAAVESRDEEVSEKAVRVTFEQAEEQSWKEIEQYLRTMQPYEFQELVASLLRAMGYFVSWVSPPGKDGGIDVLASGDPLGTKPPRIKVQVKRVAQNVSVEGLRSFMALLGDDDVGLFVTTGGFTKDAEEEARTQEKRRITLLDLEHLFDLWVEHYDRLDEASRRRLPLQKLWFLAPES